MRNLFKPSVLFCLSGIAFAVASLNPETYVSAFLALVMGVLFVAGLESGQKIYRGALYTGICFHLIAFYWVPKTVQVFGGFSTFGSFAVFLLFVLTASLQFLVVAFLYNKLRSQMGLKIGFVLPVVWMFTEAVFPRLFPWQLGHVLIVLSPIAACAEFIGVVPLSGLVLWWSVSCLQLYRSREQLFKTHGAVCLLSILAVCLGSYSNYKLSLELKSSKPIKVALVQGNLSTEQKGDVAFLQANIERYQKLTEKAVALGAEMVFWPESVLNQWLPEEIGNIRGTQFDPAPMVKTPLVYGTLAFEPRTSAELDKLKNVYVDHPRLLAGLRFKKYNAAVGITQQGDIVGRYYKRILMPFGEYLPFAETFPFIRSVSPQTGDFSPGQLEEPFVFNLENAAETQVRVGVLICYEDLIPSLTRVMVSKNANLLVNLTNDAWYGNTAAPNQHHLLAQWRAIEARRFFLRVTNTGKTAIVNPYGRTQSKLAGFVEDSLIDSVVLLERESFYSKWGELPLGVLFFLGLALAYCFRRKEAA